MYCILKQLAEKEGIVVFSGFPLTTFLWKGHFEETILQRGKQESQRCLLYPNKTVFQKKQNKKKDTMADP